MATNSIEESVLNKKMPKIRSSMDKSRMLEIEWGIASPDDIQVTCISGQRILEGYQPNSKGVNIIKQSLSFGIFYWDCKNWICVDIIIDEIPVRAIISSATDFSSIDSRFLQRNKINPKIVGQFIMSDIGGKASVDVTPLCMIDGGNKFDFEFGIDKNNSLYSRYGIEVMLGQDYLELRRQINKIEQIKVKKRI